MKLGFNWTWIDTIFFGVFYILLIGFFVWVFIS